MGGLAGAHPAAEVGFSEGAVSGDVVGFPHPGPWPPLPAILLCLFKVDTVPKSSIGITHLTWEDGCLQFKCQQVASTVLEVFPSLPEVEGTYHC